MEELDVAASDGAAGPAPGAGAGTTGAGASSPDDTLPAGPVRRSPSLRPALLVLGLAAFILVLFGVGSALTAGSGTPTHAGATPQTVPAGRTKVAGTTLEAVPAKGELAPLVHGGTPPADVVDALPLPAGSTRVAAAPTRGITLFSASERFTVPATQAAVVAFYRSELAAVHWKIVSVGPARGTANATEVLAQRAGSDGWYWEVGAVVSPTTFPPGSTASAPTGTTPFTLRLFQLNDAA